MTMNISRRRSLAALATAAGLTLGACGGAATTQTVATPTTQTVPTPTTQGTGPTTTAPAATATPAATAVPSDAATPTPAPAVDTAFPAIDVVEVTSGAPVNLSTLAGSDRPTLVWFWAPH